MGKNGDNDRYIRRGAPLVILGLSVLLAGCDADNDRTDKAKGRTIAKVCKDGTRVFQRPDGSHYIGGLGGANVSGPEVCE